MCTEERKRKQVHKVGKERYVHRRKEKKAGA